MLQIDGITDEPKQSYRLPVVGSDLQAVMNLTWRDTQNSWFIDISYDTFSVKNIRLCRMLNVLNQFKNRIPFGLMVTSSYRQDPFTLESFSDGSCKIYILSQEEIDALEDAFG